MSAIYRVFNQREKYLSYKFIFLLNSCMCFKSYILRCRPVIQHLITKNIRRGCQAVMHMGSCGVPRGTIPRDNKFVPSRRLLYPTPTLTHLCTIIVKNCQQQELRRKIPSSTKTQPISHKHHHRSSQCLSSMSAMRSQTILEV